MLRCVCAVVVAAGMAASPAAADRQRTASVRSAAGRAAAVTDCGDELEARAVSWKPAIRKGVVFAVEIQGPLGGVTWDSVAGKALVIDCSLAVSLADAGRYLADLGVERVRFSSAYDVRNVRGTDRRSKHSFGLAIDVHGFEGAEIGAVRVDHDYEQGLGDAVDCIGQPLTRGGAVLKVLQCQLVRSGLFRLVLSPDFDDAHHDHFHLEARPWSERAEVRSQVPAIY